MKERRRVMMGIGVKEPYTRLLFLETTGTQYIDTGYRPNNKTRIYARMQTTESTPYGRLFGCVSGSNYNSSPAVVLDWENNYNGTLHVMWGNVSGWTNLQSITGDYGIHTYEINRGVVSYDGTQVHDFEDSDTWQTTVNMAIFDYFKSTGISGGDERMIGRVYEFKIWEDDVPVRDFVPVLVDGVAYLYDKVTKQLYGNAGTGVFRYAISESNLIRTEYIETDGAQAINTSIVPKDNGEYSIDCLLTTVENDTPEAMVTTYSYTYYVRLRFEFSYRWSWVRAGFLDQGSGEVSINTRTRHLYTIDKKGLYIDGNQSKGWSSSRSFETGYNEKISIIKNTFIGRIYGAQIKEGGVLVLDLIPGRIGTVGCMYDRVSGRVYPNDGTGDFRVGPDV